MGIAELQALQALPFPFRLHFQNEDNVRLNWHCTTMNKSSKDYLDSALVPILVGMMYPTQNLALALQKVYRYTKRILLERSLQQLAERLPLAKQPFLREQKR